MLTHAHPPVLSVADTLSRWLRAGARKAITTPPHHPARCESNLEQSCFRRWGGGPFWPLPPLPSGSVTAFPYARSKYRSTL